MKKLLSCLAVFSLIFIFGIAISSQGPFKTNTSAQNNNDASALQPGDASIKRSDKKAAINVLFVDYHPVKSGSLQVDVYDSQNVLLASQTEIVKKSNGIATACVYVDNSVNTQAVTAVLNGAGFSNKQVSYVES